MSKKYVRYQGGNEWSALYIDGKLDKYGDHYIVDERIEELLGVEVRNSDAFVLDDDHTVCPLLTDVEDRKTMLESIAIREKKMRDDAADLLAQADQLQKDIAGKL
jgi:hypothetical protein